jgi:hypothetical protein
MGKRQSMQNTIFHSLTPSPPKKVRESWTGLEIGHTNGGRKLMLNLTKGSETMEEWHQGLRGLLENLSGFPQTCPLDVTGFDA